MAVQFNPYAGQIQSAVTNPFQQREDPSQSVRRNDPPAKTQAASSADEKSESRSAEKTESRQESEESPRSTSQRGRLLDVSV